MFYFWLGWITLALLLAIYFSFNKRTEPMFNNLSLRARRGILLGITSFVVAYVRSFLQYHLYFWGSIEQFLISWLIHYLAILFLIIVSLVFIKMDAHFFLGKDTKSSSITMDEFTVYVSVVLLIAAVAIFLLAHLQPAGMDNMYE